MPLPKLLISLLTALLLGAGCINLPEVDSAQQEDAGVPASTPDSGQATLDAGAKPDASAEPDGGDYPPDASTPTTLTVTMLAPNEPALTNDLVEVRVQVTGGTPDKVELLVGDQLLTALTSPYTYQWSTRPVAEGMHRLVARATLGDQTFTSEVREVVVDRTPPQVASRTPMPGAQDVWVRQPIEATFSEPLKASTLTADAVRLTVGTTDVAATAALSTDGRKLTVTPSSRILVPNAVKLTLSATLTDMAGNALTLPSDTWAWSLPTSFPLKELRAPPGSYGGPLYRIALTKQGLPIVAWRERSHPTGSSSNIYIYRWTGNEWLPITSPANPSPNYAAYGQENLQLHLDSSDKPVIAWIHADQPESDAPTSIQFSRWNDSAWFPIGESFANSQIEVDATGSFSSQLDTQNNPIVAWTQSPHRSSTSVWKWTNNKWSDVGPPLTANPTAPATSNALLLLDSSSNPTAVWHEGKIHARRWMNGVQGWAWYAIGTPLGAASTPVDGNTRAVLDTSGNLTIAWLEQLESGGNSHVRQVHQWTGSSWAQLGESSNFRFIQTNSTGNLFALTASHSQQTGQTTFQPQQWSDNSWQNLGAALHSPTGTTVFYPELKFGTSDQPFISWSAYKSDGTAYVYVHQYNH